MGEYDENAYPTLKLYKFPCLDVADVAGSSRSANFVMMGAAVKLTGWFERDLCVEVIREYFTKAHKEKLIDMNIRAFDAGYHYDFGD